MNKNFQPNKKFKQGYFNPKNPEKYIGNKINLIYRSNLEYKFMIICDFSPIILKWSYETHIVPYYNPIDKKVHKYIVDFYIEVKDESVIKKYLVEVKPEYKLTPPVLRESKKMNAKSISNYNYEVEDYIKNQMKWKFAEAYAEKIGCEFVRVTDAFLKTLK